jgi:RNA polymerase sigma factor (sigma-70 family)
MFAFQPKPDSRAKFENLLLDYYPRLIEWALQLTRRDRTEAEDLVQELYLRFARLDTVLDHIENLESYLFLVLRNLHYAHLRRARTSAIDDLAIDGHDTLDHRLRAVDHHELAFVRADLEQICDYLCERKNTSRSASILLLRYFLGYFPGEVMKLLPTTRIAVDKAMQAARREARLELGGSSVPRKAVADVYPKPSGFRATDDPRLVFLALHARIFDSCTGPCFSLSFLKQHYADPGGGFTTEELAHLASCRSCLDRANRLLGLPLLAERSPDEVIGRDTPQGPDGDGGGTPRLVSSRSKRAKEDVGRIRRRMERRIQEAMEHRPERLYISVDGDVRVSQRVTAQMSELQVELGRHEKPTYVEVLSEQSICIAFLLVQAPKLDQGLNQVHEMKLSDDRTIKVVMSFASESPTIDVFYHDPLAGLEVAEDEFEVGARGRGLFFQGIDAVAPVPARKAFAKFLNWVRSWFLFIFTLKMNPLFTTAVVLGLASIVCFVLWTRNTPRVSSAELLKRAEVWDTSTPGANRPGVIYQKVRISAPSRSIERTIYRDPAGKRQPRHRDLSPPDQMLKERFERAGVNWDTPLSVSSFEVWHSRQRSVRDTVTRSSDRLLTLTSTANDGGPITQESLTVRESDFHPIRRTFETRDTGTVEVAELSYSVFPWSDVNPDIFEPLASMPDVNGPHLRGSLLPHLPQEITPAQLDLAELSARLVLNRLGFDANSRIEISRNLDGVHVQGLVDTETQKSQLQAQLRFIPHVVPSILTVQEMENNATSNSSITSVHESSDVAAAPSSLEQYFTGHGLDHQEFSSETQEFLDGSFAVKWETEQISTLLQRFSTNDTLPSEARAALGELLVQHKTALLAALGREERALMTAQLIAHPSTASASVGKIAESLRKDAGENFALCIELTSDNQSAPRPAQTIAPQLAASIAELRAAALQISVTALPASPSPGNAGLANKNN